MVYRYWYRTKVLFLYGCKFNNIWTEELNFLSPSYIEVCHTDFSIGHIGKNDATLHNTSQRHSRAAEAQKGTPVMLCLR